MRWFSLCALLLLAALILSGSFSVVTAQNVELEQAKTYFLNGEFQRAIDVLERLIVTKTLSRRDYQEAAEYLAVAYVSVNQDEKAQQVFANVLQRDRDYRPSELWWPHKRLMTCFYRTAQQVQPQSKPESQGPGIKTIAIMDFENNSIEEPEKYDNLGGALAKILISDLAVLSDLKVVERERIQFLIEELELTDKKVGGKNIIDPSMAPRVGKLLGAHSFVFGSFIRIGKKFRIDARLVKTETGEVFKTASVEGDPDKIIELTKKLTLKITKDLDVAIKKTEKKKLEEMGKQQIPIEALALFGDAMSNANQENYEEAYAKLEGALSIAPDFKKARDMLEIIKPYVL